MKHLRKSFLTLLALTLFGGAGAWAQGPTNVTQFTTDMIASWEGVNENITLADLQALGFVAVDESVAHAWTGAPTSGYAYLIYGFNEGSGSLMDMMFYDGNVGEPNQGIISKGGFYDMIANGVKWFYTGSPAIELTKAGANQWSLGQAPDYDLELQVEYYEAHALKNIPAGWQVKVNGVDQTSAIDGDSLMITETDTVTLVPAGNPRRVKSVTLEDEGPAVRTINVDGLQLNYVEGENWVQTAQRNDDVLTTDSYYVFKKNSTIVLLVDSQPISPTSTYDSSLNYYWEQW
jgi:hypothetical protein